ncbi:alpha/beta fold hydrolase [Pseudomonas aeruginosa]|uniref:alpha/beta fold hydrolase n=1 Tax=Pseudomonas aeruginosa TaxID=287 RepID=UPI0010677288|nr:alpha/beta hydrolase [Pseudomonas aeruginosa]
MKPNALIDVGSGSAVVFCHGALMDSSMFARQMDCLKAQYRCIAYDHRPAQLTSYSLSDLVDGCLYLMDELGIRQFVLAGLSMGGFLGMELARRHPDRLAGLLLMDTMATDYTAEEREVFTEMFAPLDIDGMLPASFINSFVSVIFSQKAEDEQPELVAHWTSKWASLPARSILNEHRAWMAKADYVPWLPEFEIPTLILHGLEDRGIPFHHAEVLQSGIPDSTLVALKGAGHAITEEVPEQVNQTLLDFLNRLPEW